MQGDAGVMTSADDTSITASNSNGVFYPISGPDMGALLRMPVGSTIGPISVGMIALTVLRVPGGWNYIYSATGQQTPSAIVIQPYGGGGAPMPYSPSTLWYTSALSVVFVPLPADAIEAAVEDGVAKADAIIKNASDTAAAMIRMAKGAAGG